MAAMIELMCAAHPDAGAAGPVVTTVDGVWAYCFGGAENGHEWRKIEPTTLESVRSGKHRSESHSLTTPLNRS
jgi:hypothetical protein